MVIVPINEMPVFTTRKKVGRRLISAKLPPIYLFEDVATAQDFDDLYALQSLTNPRLQSEVGNLNLVDLSDVPWGINGCNYAAASFTHVNPDGSRFSDGTYGVMYVADSIETAIAEVKHHQQAYCKKVHGLAYERFVFKQLICTFKVKQGLDIKGLSVNDPIYHLEDYSASRVLGLGVKKAKKYSSIRYNSVRRKKGVCHAIFTPKEVSDIIPSTHYEMVWDGGKISNISTISTN
jgi:hypothetical protein